MSVDEKASTILETINRNPNYEVFPLPEFPLTQIGFPQGFKASLYKLVDNGECREAFINIYNIEGEPIAYVFHYAVDTAAVMDGNYGEAIAGKVVLDKEFRGGGRGLQLWKEAEKFLLQVHKQHDSVQRVVLDMSGTGWTKRNYAQIFSHLQSVGMDWSELAQVDDEGVFMVLLKVTLEKD